MSNRKCVRGAKYASAVAAGVLMTGTIGAASAAPAPVGPESETSSHVVVQAASVAQPASLPQRGAALAAPASWRETAAGSSSTTARPSRGTARQARAVAFARYANFTLRSKDTKDMRGVEASLYRGAYYRKAVEPKRRCIAQRESEGHYDVVSRSGLYFGAYQASRALARGATWMMLKEHKKLMGEKSAKQVLARLRAKPMNTWPRYWQDAAFHTIMNWDGTGSGAAHWAGGRWHC